MAQIVRPILYWAPRAFCVLFALFLVLFALDVFRDRKTVRPKNSADWVHLLRAIVVVGMLVIAWRWEWAGAALFATGAVWYLIVERRNLAGVLTISGPLLVVAALFLADWLLRTPALVIP
jgi:hypothetical protein